MAPLPTTNLTLNDPGSNTFPLLRLTDCVPGTALQRLEFILKFGSHLTEYTIFLTTSRLVMHSRGVRHFLAKDHNIYCGTNGAIERFIIKQPTRIKTRQIIFIMRWHVCELWLMWAGRDMCRGSHGYFTPCLPLEKSLCCVFATWHCNGNCPPWRTPITLRQGVVHFIHTIDITYMRKGYFRWYS